jgi:hypothetical protein
VRSPTHHPIPHIAFSPRPRPVSQLRKPCASSIVVHLYQEAEPLSRGRSDGRLRTQKTWIATLTAYEERAFDAAHPGSLNLHERVALTELTIS